MAHVGWAIRDTISFVYITCNSDEDWMYLKVDNLLQVKYKKDIISYRI